MAKIVAAMACSHAPQILIQPKVSQTYVEQLSRVHGALKQLRTVLLERKPDALLVLGSDHLEAFFLNNYPMLCVFTGGEAEGSMAGKHFGFRVHEDLAKTLLFGLVDLGFDPSFSQEIELDHPYLSPLSQVLEDYDLPIVPFHMNSNVPPLIPPRRCYELGKAIGRVIKEKRPAGERIAIMATGGLSHYPGTPYYGKLDLAFDDRVLEHLQRGEGEKLTEFSSEQLDEAGNFELRTIITMLGATGKLSAEVLIRQPTYHIDYAVLNFKVPDGGL